MEQITSAQNPKVKELVRLRERRGRKKSGLFLIEGYRELLRATEAGVKFVQLFSCEELFLGSNEDELIAQIDAPRFHLPSHLFEKVSYRDRPDGLIAIAEQRQFDIAHLETILAKPNPFIVVVEAIEKPGNLGSILRSCDGAGVDALIIADPCTDVHNPNVVRSSVGTLFTTPVFEITSDQAFELLKGVTLIATSPDAKKNYCDIDMQGPVAIALGTEQLGLTDAWLEKCQEKVSIPMLGKADSLNVSNAATLLLYEVVRQRRPLP
ncbi:MAG: RNA methyltransferase [Simkaniaceae bacterium]|nr:RNA methyltransferase [Simkaniaceae bacterium]